MKYRLCLSPPIGSCEVQLNEQSHQLKGPLRLDVDTQGDTLISVVELNRHTRTFPGGIPGFYGSDNNNNNNNRLHYVANVPVENMHKFAKEQKELQTVSLDRSDQNVPQNEPLQRSFPSDHSSETIQSDELVDSSAKEREHVQYANLVKNKVFIQNSATLIHKPVIGIKAMKKHFAADLHRLQKLHEQIIPHERLHHHHHKHNIHKEKPPHPIKQHEQHIKPDKHHHNHVKKTICEKLAMKNHTHEHDLKHHNCITEEATTIGPPLVLLSTKHDIPELIIHFPDKNQTEEKEEKKQKCKHHEDISRKLKELCANATDRHRCYHAEGLQFKEELLKNLTACHPHKDKDFEKFVHNLHVVHRHDKSKIDLSHLHKLTENNRRRFYGKRHHHHHHQHHVKRFHYINKFQSQKQTYDNHQLVVPIVPSIHGDITPSGHIPAQMIASGTTLDENHRKSPILLRFNEQFQIEYIFHSC